MAKRIVEIAAHDSTMPQVPGLQQQGKHPAGEAGGPSTLGAGEQPVAPHLRAGVLRDRDDVYRGIAV